MKSVSIRIVLLSMFSLIATGLFAQLKLPEVPIRTLQASDDLDPRMYNLSQLNWMEAFDSLNQIMANRYAYTSWKAIDWEQKYAETAPKIQQAVAGSDTVLLTATLLEFLYSIPDGHVHLSGNLSAFERERLSGTFGLNMIPLTDGKIVANIVPEGFPAYEAGMRCGDESVSWNLQLIN